MQNMPRNHALARIGRLQREMAEADIGVIFLTYSRSTLYYAGTTQPAICVITPEYHHLFVLRAYDTVLEESWLERAHISSGGDITDLKAKLNRWAIKKGRLGLELDIVPALQYLKFSRTFPEFDIIDISKVLLEQRKIKDSSEIEATKKACQILHQGHLRVMNTLTEGMTELELSSEIEDAHRRAGHEGLYFMRQFDFFMGRGPVASGENLSRIAGKIMSITGVGLSPSIPMGASRRAIQQGDMIIADIPTHHKGYHADQSRTYVLGKPPETCKKMYNAMKEIADRMLDAMGPGLRCDALYKNALAFSDALGMGPYFMRIDGDSKSIPFIGHGVGIELNEPPLLGSNTQDVLEEGMVLALELEMCAAPGEVVKLEDTLVVTSKGVELLTITPRHLHQI